MTNAAKATCMVNMISSLSLMPAPAIAVMLCAGEVEASYQIFDHGISDYKD